MKRLLRHGRLTTIVALIALTGLALATEPAPAAHAGSYPSITAAGGARVVSVHGSSFTPKGPVLVEVRRYNALTKTWPREDKTYLTALGPHYVCHTSPWRTICGWNAGGQVTAGLVSEPGTVRVSAYDVGSGCWSNRVTRYVFPIP